MGGLVDYWYLVGLNFGDYGYYFVVCFVVFYGCECYRLNVCVFFFIYRLWNWIFIEMVLVVDGFLGGD